MNLSVTGIILNSKVRVDPSEGTGTEIDAEDDLGPAKLKLQPLGALRWRPGRRHELEVGYQFARRTAETTLQRTIDFGDSTYVVGTDVHSRFNTDQAFLTYRFAFRARERDLIGAGVGLDALLVDTELDALDNGDVDFTEGKKPAVSCQAVSASRLGPAERCRSGRRTQRHRRRPGDVRRRTDHVLAPERQAWGGVGPLTEVEGGRRWSKMVEDG